MPDAWYRKEWSKAASAVLESPVAALGAARAPEVVRQAGLHAAQSRFAGAIARGEPLEQAMCDVVRALSAPVDLPIAWAIAEGLGGQPGGAEAGALGHGLIHHARGQFARAWSVFRSLDDTTLARFVPVEAVDAALGSGDDAAAQRATSIAAHVERVSDATLVDLAGRMIAFGHRQSAAACLAELRRRSGPGPDDRRAYAASLIASWLDATPPTIPSGAVTIAILDYQTPDHVFTSGNAGDYVQSLAVLGNLARLEGVAFTGDDGLGDFANELAGRLRPEHRLRGSSGAIHLVAVDRDFSTACTAPEGTWMIAYGWHMHPLFELKYDFPYHPNIRPIFVSFHINRLDMLTEDGLDYLRRHAPIGCRDWTTVFVLLSAGIDAFFSGCVTTTVDALYPARSEAFAGGATVGVIDLPPSAAGHGVKVRTYSHQSDEYRYMSLTRGLRAASDMLAGYQRDLARVVTKRLHAFLPLTSLGVPVDFRPQSPGDVRFAGLADLTPGDPRLEEIRGNLRALLGELFSTIVSGASEDEVRAHWRELTSAQVAEARRRFEAPVRTASTSIDIEAAVAAAKAGSRRFGRHDAVDEAAVSDVVLAFDQNLTWPAGVLVESMLANTAGPVRLWVLGRGLDDAYVDWLAAAFPALPITYLPCDSITFGPAGRPRRIPARITISTMDRLLLPLMLDGVARAVYMDVDTILLDDVTRLARMDLGGAPVAARDTAVTAWSEWYRAGRHLPEDVALELRRSMGFRHGFHGAALNAGVEVMDLDRMRADGFTARSLAWVEEYGLNDQDCMLAYAGSSRRILDPRWNALPVLEDVEDPGLIHWASLGKPWEPELTFAQERWRAYAASLRDRAGPPPTAQQAVSGPVGSLRNPVAVGSVEQPLAPAIEARIAAVTAEHLSYLNTTSLRTLAAMAADLEAASIDGLVVECGTARGGSAIVLAAAKATERPMRVYDVFGMIPPPTGKDGADVHKRYATIVEGRSSGIAGETYYGYRDDLLGEVTESFARHGLPVDAAGITLVQGRFEDTLVIDEPVALAHLDGDWYSSTMTCLSRIVPRLSPGGRIVIDDYDTWSGCRSAVDEYFAGRTGFRFERRGRLHVVKL